METISMPDFVAQKPENVIDVREAIEYQMGHVPGAVNMPLSEFGQTYQELDKDTHYYIICQSGGRSAQAVAFLEQQGYKATNVSGGTGAYPLDLE